MSATVRAAMPMSLRYTISPDNRACDTIKYLPESSRHLTIAGAEDSGTGCHFRLRSLHQ
ncbi:Uncharacterised protein [Halioglobus japonicus]|nr:Uncharacterised protein [Halioglobus japonicus]